MTEWNKDMSAAPRDGSFDVYAVSSETGAHQRFTDCFFEKGVLECWHWPEFPLNYAPTHWQPLPSPPEESK